MSSNLSGRSRNGSPVRSRCLHFDLFLFSSDSRDGLTRIVLLVLSLLVDAGRNVGTAASCKNDVGDVGVAELDESVEKSPGFLFKADPILASNISKF